MTKTSAAHSVPVGGFENSEAYARQLDEVDPLASYRDQFEIPNQPNGEPVIYMAGNSLGLMPKDVRAIVNQELDDWADLALDAHFKAATPWYSYHEVFRESGARLVGANPGEVVMMNSLTVNLHLMMVSFYRPTRQRWRILMEEPCFPSDSYAVRSHLQARRIDPDKAILRIKPRAGEHCLRTDDIDDLLDEHAHDMSMVLLGGVNFFTGQVLDMKHIAKSAHGLSRDVMVGFDLAHAAGNIPLHLHDWNVDFAAWCSYKYLNAGPGGVAGCFVHERHATRYEIPRYAGWWGNDPATRFKLHLIPKFAPVPSADGWQISNPPILTMAALQASMRMFSEIGMGVLRTKSQLLTGYLRWLIEQQPTDRYQIITPSDPEGHGCQLSILVHDEPNRRFEALQAEGVVGDFREPNVIRLAPVPLYNSFMDVWRVSHVLARTL